MGKLKVFGCVIFLILAIGGGILFQDWRKKETAKTEQAACNYFASLLAQDPNININAQNGGPVLHPWYLKQTPTMQEIEDKTGIEKTSDGEWYTWTLHCDPDGGTNVREVKIKVKLDAQNKLFVLSGIHGTATAYAAGWQPN